MLRNSLPIWRMLFHFRCIPRGTICRQQYSAYLEPQLGTFQNNSTLLIVFCRFLKLILLSVVMQECKDLIPKRIHSTLHYLGSSNYPFLSYMYVLLY
jgi:hypothetical protein